MYQRPSGKCQNPVEIEVTLHIIKAFEVIFWVDLARHPSQKVLGGKNFSDLAHSEYKGLSRLLHTLLLLMRY
jgi:hypothetical protein